MAAMGLISRAFDRLPEDGTARASGDGRVPTQPVSPDRGSVTSYNPSLRYMPGVDVLRGIAILMVLVFHATAGFEWLFWTLRTPFDRQIQWFLHLGTFGVHLFFVLSGFLITGILIDSRTRTDFFRTFYQRRIVRIVPAYLALLLVLTFSHYITLRYLAICLMYFCNMSGIFGVNAQYGPLWSLSVEEQFYLVWPLVVRKCSLQALVWVSLVLVLGTPFLRLALLYGPHALHDIYYKTWAVLDFFAAGALLAISVRHPISRVRLMQSAIALSLSGIFFILLQRMLPYPSTHFLQNVWQSTFLDAWLLFFTGITMFAYLKPRLASLTIFRPLVFLAKISYGLYLYHQVVFDFTVRHWPTRLTAAMRPQSRALLEFFVEVALAIALAALSRYTFEEYFLRHKPRASRTPLRPSAMDEIA